MNTFLPLPSFKDSAEVLDRKRLGKQRVEVLQLLKAMTTGRGGWVNHPAAKMWRGYIDALVAYGLAICKEWIDRGYKDTVREQILAYRTVDYEPSQDNVPMPPWLGRAEFHASHRGNLLRKEPNHYGEFGWADSPLLPYEWPRA